MATLLVTFLKPNPTGKDRPPHGGPSAAQLGAEWVQFMNPGAVPVDLSDVELYHLAYPASGGAPTWALVTNFTGSLSAGKSVRVHSGQVRKPSVLNHVDLIGADYHIFTGRDAYVWNNAEGDTAGLWSKRTRAWIDKASYDPNPPEGVILRRVGNRLVP